MSANKQINKLKLQNYAYEILDDGTFVQANTTSNVYFQPFKKVGNTYVPIPGHGQYHLIEAMDINWSYYTINGKQIVTSYDLISYTASAYWRQSVNPTSIQISSAYNTVIGAFSLAEGSYNVVHGSYSHVEGYWNVTYNDYETAIGKYNVSHVYNGYTYPESGNTIFSIGNGDYNEEDNEVHRENIIEVRDNNKVYVNGVGNYEKSIYNDHVYSLQYTLDNLKKLGHDTFYDYGNWQKQMFHWKANCVYCTDMILGRTTHNQHVVENENIIYLQISDKYETDGNVKTFKIYKEALLNLHENIYEISIYIFFSKGSAEVTIAGNDYGTVTIDDNDYRTDFNGFAISKSANEWINMFQDNDYIEIHLNFTYYGNRFKISPYIYKKYEINTEKPIYHFYTRKSEHGNYSLWYFKPIYDKIIYVKYHQHILNSDKMGNFSLSTYRYNKKLYNIDNPSSEITEKNIFSNYYEHIYMWKCSSHINYKGRTYNHSRTIKWRKTDAQEISQLLGVTINDQGIVTNFITPTINNYQNTFLKGKHKIGLEKIKTIGNLFVDGSIYVKLAIEIYDGMFHECILKRYFNYDHEDKLSLRLTGKIYTFDELGLKIPM